MKLGINSHDPSKAFLYETHFVTHVKVSFSKYFFEGGLMNPPPPLKETLHDCRGPGISPFVSPSTTPPLSKKFAEV